MTVGSALRTVSFDSVFQMTVTPSRLHVLLARESSRALVIRRGPSKTTCTLLWDRRTDRFTVGQWVRARIYEGKCDLSPDGQHFIYGAFDGRRSREVQGGYTAISHAPYLKALDLYAEGTTYFGGGLFTSNQSYWHNGGGELVRDSRKFRRDPTPGIEGAQETFGLCLLRLHRDGWSQIEQWKKRGGGRNVWQKPLPRKWLLRKIFEGYGEQHELVQPNRDVLISCPDWEWADFDGDRLLWAARGCLWTGELRGSKLVNEAKLHDFNGMKFELIEAPY